MASGFAADGSTMPSDGIPSLTFNTANNRITTAGFEYDVAGNQTRALAEDQVNWLRYEYDAANRLVNIKDDNGNPIQSQQFGVGNERVGLTDYVSNQSTYFNAPVSASVLFEFVSDVAARDAELAGGLGLDVFCCQQCGPHQISLDGFERFR